MEGPLESNCAWLGRQHPPIVHSIARVLCSSESCVNPVCPGYLTSYNGISLVVLPANGSGHRVEIDAESNHIAGGPDARDDMTSPGSERWRGALLEQLRMRFARNPSLVFGVEHALAVERHVMHLCREHEYEALTEAQRLCVRVAALLHDAAYCERTEDWSASCQEHVCQSRQLVEEILEGVPELHGRQGLVGTVAGLVEHHDQTAFAYPWATNGGRPISWEHGTTERPSALLLSIVKEADGLEHVGSEAIQGQVEFWLDTGIPRVGLHGAPLAAWMWGESVAGNLRLLGKRACVDAASPYGRDTALEAHKEIERVVQLQCSLTDTVYERELADPEWRDDARQRGSDPNSLLLVRFYPWQLVEQRLRSCQLAKDGTIHPYRDAVISTRVLPISDLAPMALYLNRQNLTGVRELQDALMLRYCLSLWDLPGLVCVRHSQRGELFIGPPVVERYTETAREGHPLVNGILDGLHRCSVALEVGLDAVRVALVSGVPYPPLPLPVDWNEIKVVETTPATERKRRLRYATANDYPDQEIFKTSVDITETNFSYFLYRDLTPLGSRGPREEGT